MIFRNIIAGLGLLLAVCEIVIIAGWAEYKKSETSYASFTAWPSLIVYWAQLILASLLLFIGLIVSVHL